jgi:ABC-type multidrug transport system fused ATPase/permease subunit
MKSLFSEVLFTRFHARLLILLCSFMATVFGLFSPFLQKEFIDQLTGAPASTAVYSHLLTFSTPVMYVVLAFFAVLLAQTFSQLTTYLGAREAIFMQRIFAEKLYDKTLGLRVDTMSHRPLGEIVSIYATDVPGATVFLDQTLPAGASTVFPLILAPFAISLIFEIPIWPTLGVMICIVIMNSFMAFRQSKFFFRFKQLAAERIGMVNEWIQNIRTIRILGWIHHFEKEIFAKREVETVNRVKMVTNGQIMNAVSSSITFVLNVITLYSLVHYSKHTVTSGELLALLWIVGVFLTRPFRQMPWFFTFAFDSWTSLRRLEDFLNLTNSETAQASMGASAATSRENVVLEVHGLNLRIGQRQILKNINLTVHEGEFVAVVGEVGSGKSMLLLSLLGETGAHYQSYHLESLDAKKASLDEVRAHFAYVPQEGFIMSASLRENVGFIYDIDPDRDPEIGESLRLAQFDLSTERVENGLDTEIGERGVNLSGGQKQRVSLARVHFYNAPILLLDDSLSAVDVDTEQKIFDQLLLGAWKNRTRVLVTHRLSALSRVDRILFMEEGQIIDQGTFTELLARNKKFQDYTTTVAKEATRGAE